MEAWAAQIIAKIATIKAMHTYSENQVFQKRRKCATTTPVQTPEHSFNNLQLQFEQSSKRYAYDDSEADEKASFKVGKLLEDVFQKSAQDFDPLGFKLDPLASKALFDKVKLKKVEKHWKLPDVKESVKGKKSVQFLRAVESSAEDQEGLYKSIRHIAFGNTGNLFGELLDIFEASAGATGDAQSVKEGQLDGIQQRTSQEEILSETSKKRFSNINKMQKEVFQRPSSSNRNFGLGRGKWSRRGRFSNNKQNSEPSKYPNLRNQEYDFLKGRNASKNTKRFRNRTGIQANWSYPGSTQYLESNKFIPQQRCSQIQDQALSNLLEKELREEIIDEVNQRDLSWINPIFYKYRKEKKKRRKITDCLNLNKSLISDHFQMEDVHTLREMIRPGDRTIQIDLESAFHHMLVNENLKSFLGFTIHGRFYRYRAMCFGIRHAPLTFHKTLRPIVHQKRIYLRFKCVTYCDDYIFINNNQTKLKIQVPLIIQTLNNYGFKISVSKLTLIPTQSVEFLG
ncbi:MAG: hypothetical protein EZS28_019110 [Streblomastix strix]|uniref:Reverse transcriptase domain-containing protein n=1 Tax=Streblomastix strix TaxID=222440 RepID=A0A5J4VRZ8_9EUKA|nr:MAG: hypothetical protein EZS28_019110 [Streblomastix strix]